VTDDTLPDVLDKHDLVKLLKYKSPRSIERLDRAGRLPEPLFGSGFRKRWSRDRILEWLNGSGTRRRR